MSTPIDKFKLWYDEACVAGEDLPNAMSISTLSIDESPNCRIVLIKEFSNDGFLFVTDSTSAKGLELSINPKCSLCFHWKTTKKQVRIKGVASIASDVKSDELFAQREKGKQIAASMSMQSSRLDSIDNFRNDFDKAFNEMKNTTIQRPERWKAYIVSFHSVEFWKDGEHRVHERELWTKHENYWKKVFLYP